MRRRVRRRQHRHRARLRGRHLRIDRSRQRGVHRDFPSRRLKLAPLRDRGTVHFRLCGMIHLGRECLPSFLPDSIVVRSLRASVFFSGNRLDTERTVGDVDRNPFVRHRTGKRHVVGVVLIRLRGRLYVRKCVRLTGRMPGEPHVERKPHGAGLYPGHPFGVLRMIRTGKRFRNDGNYVPTGLGRPFRRVASGRIVDGRCSHVRIFL